MDDLDELLHLTHTGPWTDAQESGVYAIPAGDAFIHCCAPDQVPGVVERFFPAPHHDIIVLTVDPTDLKVVVEAAADGFGDFPHIYEPLPVDAVTDVRPLAVVLAGLG